MVGLGASLVGLGASPGGSGGIPWWICGQGREHPLLGLGTFKSIPCWVWGAGDAHSVSLCPEGVWLCLLLCSVPLRGMSQKSMIGRGALGKGLLSCQPYLSLGCPLCCPGCCLSRECQDKPWDEAAGMASPASLPLGWIEGTNSHAALLFPEQFILCSDPVAAGEVLFPFPCCFAPSSHPGQLGDYRKSTRLLPLVEDNGCVRHELQGQPRQRGFVCDLD